MRSLQVWLSFCNRCAVLKVWTLLLEMWSMSKGWTGLSESWSYFRTLLWNCWRTGHLHTSGFSIHRLPLPVINIQCTPLPLKTGNPRMQECGIHSDSNYAATLSLEVLKVRVPFSPLTDVQYFSTRKQLASGYPEIWLVGQAIMRCQMAAKPPNPQLSKLKHQ